MKITAAVLATLVLTSTAPAQDARAGVAVPAGVSWPQSESLARKLEAIEQRQLAGSRKRETVTVTEGELNSYLNLTYASQLPKGVSGVEVRLDRERIFAKGQVDLERVRGKVKSDSMFNPMSLLSGLVPVEASGRFQNRDGFGTIQWEAISISSIPMSVSMLESMVVSSTRSAKRPQGVDIHAPFRLPYSARSIRLEPGRALVDF